MRADVSTVVRNSSNGIPFSNPDHFGTSEINKSLWTVGVPAENRSLNRCSSALVSTSSTCSRASAMSKNYINWLHESKFWIWQFWLPISHDTPILIWTKSRTVDLLHAWWSISSHRCHQICSAPGMVTWHNNVLFQRHYDDTGQDCLIIVNLFRG